MIDLVDFIDSLPRFILEKCDRSVKVENKKRKVIIAELTRRGYDSDPVKSWKRAQAKGAGLDESHEEESDVSSFLKNR